jgi:GABA permease
VLVVAIASVEETDVPREIRDLVERGQAEMRVVAPASDLSRLQWLANEEDEARAEAEDLADDAASALGAEDKPATEVGDPDPLKAIEDALRTFPADELVIVTPPDDKAGWLESGSADEALDRFRLPVTRVESGRASPASG